jgi:hypothetical protein
MTVSVHPEANVAASIDPKLRLPIYTVSELRDHASEIAALVGLEQFCGVTGGWILLEVLWRTPAVVRMPSLTIAAVQVVGEPYTVGQAISDSHVSQPTLAGLHSESESSASGQAPVGAGGGKGLAKGWRQRRQTPL